MSIAEARPSKPGAIVELRSWEGRGGTARLSLAVRSDLPIGEQIGHLCRTAEQAFDFGSIEQALLRNNFSRTNTARNLGISRVTLYNKMRKYGMLRKNE